MMWVLDGEQTLGGIAANRVSMTGDVTQMG